MTSGIFAHAPSPTDWLVSGKNQTYQRAIALDYRSVSYIGTPVYHLQRMSKRPFPIPKRRCDNGPLVSSHYQNASHQGDSSSIQNVLYYRLSVPYLSVQRCLSRLLLAMPTPFWHHPDSWEVTDKRVYKCSTFYTTITKSELLTTVNTTCQQCLRHLLTCLD